MVTPLFLSFSALGFWVDSESVNQNGEHMRGTHPSPPQPNTTFGRQGGRGAITAVWDMVNWKKVAETLSLELGVEMAFHGEQG